MHELRRAIVDLGLKGVTVSSQVNGLSLDAKEFTPFYDLIQKLDVPIFVHPALAPKGYSLMNDYQLPVILTREFDLGVAVTRLIAGGVIERLSGSAICLCPLRRRTGRLQRTDRALVVSFQVGLNRSKSISTGSTSIWPGSKAVRSHCAARLEGIRPERLVFATDYPQNFNNHDPKSRKERRRRERIHKGNSAAAAGGAVKEAMLGQTAAGIC